MSTVSLLAVIEAMEMSNQWILKILTHRDPPPSKMVRSTWELLTGQTGITEKIGETHIVDLIWFKLTGNRMELK